MSEIVDRIDQAGHIVLIAHVNPDADSLGSASAMYTYLMRLHKKVTLFCASKRIDSNLVFLPWFDKIRHVFPAGADLAISFDCGTELRLGTDPQCDLINFDHHSSNGHYGTYNLVDTAAISTTQVLYDFFCSNGIKINAKIATSLYAGLLDDSQGFSTVKTDEKTFNMAADLVHQGAHSVLCSRALMQSMSLAAMRLKGMMLQQVRLLKDARIAVLTVTRKMLEETGAKEVDCEAALQESLYLPSVETSVMIRENLNGSLKGSLRGKGEIDLSGIAGCFGGGGHWNSAGFDLPEGKLDEVLKETIKLLDKEMN